MPVKFEYLFKPAAYIKKIVCQQGFYNTYFTLPVRFAMLSNHYRFTWSHP